MVVEHPVRSAEHGLTVALGINCQANARLNVVLVSLNSFLQPELVVRGQGKALRLLELGRDLHVVTQTVIQSDFWIYAPGVLPEESQRNVVERIAGAAEALNIDGRKPRTIGLHGGEAGERRRKTK